MSAPRPPAGLGRWTERDRTRVCGKAKEGKGKERKGPVRKMKIFEDSVILAKFVSGKAGQEYGS